MTRVQEVTDLELTQAIQQSQQLLLVDFWAPWCGPCRRLAPILDDLAQAFAGRVQVLKVNVDRHQAWAQRLGVSSIPSLMLFRQGQLVGRIDGLPHPQQLAQAVQQAI